MAQHAKLNTGLSAETRHHVRAQDLATSWKGKVPALASPMLFWLAEIAAMKAIADSLPESPVTVGAGTNLKHLAPTPEGAEVVVTATLTLVSDTSLLFKISGHDGQDEVLRGMHHRTIVDAATFVKRLAQKLAIVAKEDRMDGTFRWKRYLNQLRLWPFATTTRHAAQRSQ